jgi:serine/threonine-protein kinase
VYLGSSTQDDFAVLQVTGYQSQAIPLSLTFEPMNRFLSIGYGRPDFPQGASIDGTITDINPQASFGNLPMLRLRIEADAQRVQGGYSGSPVFDYQSQRVIGLIAAFDYTEGALAVPLATVREKWSTLERFLNPQLTVPPPLPVAEPELPEGQMELDSQFYVKREPWESRSYKAIEKRAALIRIKAPRYMGKTSLLARIRNHAEQQGCRMVYLSFQEPDEDVFQELNQFLRRFCVLIGRELGISPKKLKEYWDDEFLGPKENCNEYLKCLLADLNSPLVLALDTVDRVFPYNKVAVEFFSLLRVWHEKAKENSTWAKLRLVIVHSTEVYVKMPPERSPFNVGLTVELPEFNPEQVLDLAQRHGLAWGSAEIEQMMGMVSGHPYLVRLALYYISQQDLTLSQLLEQAPTDAGIYGDHLRQHLWNLQQHPELMAAVKQVVMTCHPVRLEAMQAYKLHGMGLVNRQGNDVTPRCNLYRLYFRDHLKVS